MRIASLLASGTEILCGLGMGDAIVAISHECDFPPEILKKPRVTIAHVDSSLPSAEIDRNVRESLRSGNALYGIDLDLLTELRPDLIVTQSQCEVCAVNYADVLTAVRNTPALRGTRVVALNPTTFDEIFHDVLRVGEAAGVGSVAEGYVLQLRARVASIQSGSERIPLQDRPRVACVEWIDPLMIAANWMPDLIELAGGVCGLTTAGSRSAVTPWDAVLLFNPQVIVVMPCGFDLARAVTEAPSLFARPGWENLSAVRAGLVYAVDGNAYFNRSGPRLVDSLELLASLLHPERFPMPLPLRHAWTRLVPAPSAA